MTERGNAPAATDVARPGAELTTEVLLAALEQAPVAVAVFDRQMRYLAASRQFLADHGVDPAQPVLGRSHYEVVPDLPERWRKLHERALRGESLQAEEDVFPRSDGHVDWMSWALRPWRGPDGEIGGVVLNTERITDRVRRQRALEAAERRYRGVFDQAAVGVARVAPDGVFLEVNDRYCDIVGHTREALVGNTFQAITHPDDLRKDVRQAEALLAGEISTYSMQKRYVTASGEVVWTDLTCSLVLTTAGDPDYFVAVVEDITDRKEAEARLQDIFKIRTVGVMFWGKGFGLTDANDAFLQMTGFTREEALGLTWQELTPPEFHEVSWNAVREVTSLGETTPYEKQYYRKDGSRWWGLFAARRLGEEVVEFVLDVTERKEAEEAVRQLKENLELRVAEEVTARLNAEDALRQSQKMEAIGQLTGGVAHDFNNLLTVIRSSAGLLRRPDLPDERRRRYVDAIAETADRAARLTGQLLAFARRQALKPEVFNVGERVDSIAEMLRTVVGSRIELVTDTSCETCFVEADPSQFETALVNMAVNARDAMEEGGRLTIRVEPTGLVPKVRGHQPAEGSFVAVVVADTGAGIPTDKLPQIFEPFFTTKEPGKGTGLGLSQVYGFAKQSGGEVAVESASGEGAVFTLFLPRVAERAAASGAASVEEAGLPQRGHILVVEDNEQVGAFSTQMLAELGFETTWAANADAALKMLAAAHGRFDAVFSDVVMPGMSGIDLGRLLRERYPDLPVILTSGYSHVLANEGSQGFELLQKPYSADEITQVLRRAIRTRSAGPA